MAKEGSQSEIDWNAIPEKMRQGQTAEDDTGERYMYLLPVGQSHTQNHACMYKHKRLYERQLRIRIANQYRYKHNKRAMQVTVDVLQPSGSTKLGSQAPFRAVAAAPLDSA
ncbi:hypothetical protein M440DRAFT_1391678 [Trichoderma longibrachiatum ATCC 18648]|uniref:Uncharacterized protein n=1 Tax=Trichoderma longibrachiatum ATCC 18648 TaxID=983965 RepID=A0A2T4C3F2_TRILO|nr:hypothetical protein M440DRAFT_1391678 [Trichoderma longibrachiatum ATCC 18648]